MNDLTKNIVLWVIIAVVLLAVFSNFGARTGAPQPMPYSQFLEEVQANGIRTATFKGDTITGTRSGSSCRMARAMRSRPFISFLLRLPPGPPAGGFGS